LYRADTDFDLPEPGHYATGIAFLPRARMAMLDAQKEIARIATEEGATVLGWREVRVDPRGIGDMAAEAMPSFSQLFLTVPGTSGTDLDRIMFFIRKRCERELGTTGDRPTVYFPSLSARTVIYKGMLTTAQLERFYRDLQDPRMESAIAVVHSRFSTNTFPSWPLAHPYRLV